MEIVVATTIFAGTVTLMLTLFNYTLQINRRVQAMRQVAQGTRNFTETIAREIRNGRIDYDVATMDPACNPNGYGSIENTSLGLVNVAGEKVCFYFDQNASPSGGALYISKSGGGETVREVVIFGSYLSPCIFLFDRHPTRTLQTLPILGRGYSRSQLLLLSSWCSYLLGIRC